MILLGIAIGLMSTMVDKHDDAYQQNNSDDSYYSDENYYSDNSEVTIPACYSDELTKSENGDFTQTICKYDDSEFIRLDSITRNEKETILNLTLIGNGYGGFCVWPTEDDNNFRLIDVETNQEFVLRSLKTEIASCDTTGDERFTTLPYGETLPLTLVYDALPNTTRQLMLKEHVEEEGMNPTVIDSILLMPIDE